MKFHKTKEELCEHFTPTIGCIKDVCSCNKDPKKPPFKHEVESLSTEEVLANRSNAYEFIDFEKKETLEEAFDRIFDSIDYILFDYTSFEQGAKWQKERSYSEEEVLRLLIKRELFLELYDLANEYEDANEWFKQFKKK